MMANGKICLEDIGRELHGTIVRASLAEKCYVVKLPELGDEVYGRLPFNLVTIQQLPFTQEYHGEEQLTQLCKSYLSKEVIVQITDFNVVPNQSNELYPYFEALDLTCLHRMSHSDILELVGKTVTCEVMSMSSKIVYVRIEKKYIAACHITELSVCRYDNLRNWISVGETWKAILLYPTEGFNRLRVSRKQFYAGKDGNNELSIGDAIVGKIAGEVPSQSNQNRLSKHCHDYFIEINPGCCGIADDCEVEYSEGDPVLAEIKKIKPAGFSLKLFEPITVHCFGR